MYLFRTNDNNQIEVYSLEPKLDKITDYKRQELNKVPTNKRFLKHVTVRNGRKLSSPSGLEVCPHFEAGKEIEGLGYADSFGYIEEDARTEQIRQAYINGDFSTIECPFVYHIVGIGPTKRPISTLNLFTTERYRELYKQFEMDYIMYLPKSLYLLHLLEMGNLDFLKGENCSKQLELFDLEFVKTIDWNNVEDLAKYGILSDAVDKAQVVVKSSSEIVSLKMKNSHN